MSVGTAPDNTKRAKILSDKNAAATAQGAPAVKFGGGGLSFMQGKRARTAPVTAAAPPPERIQQPDVVITPPSVERTLNAGDGGQGHNSNAGNTSRGGSGGGDGNSGAGAPGAGSPF